MAGPTAGECEPRFEGVRRAFDAGFAKHGELGAAVSVVQGGRTVVDLWGGHQDEARTAAWQRDTLVNVFSVTKGVVATCLAMLADRGRLDVDAPVSDYWPEFAAAGKQHVRVSELLAHQAGLPAVRARLPDDAHIDWNVMTAALAAERPWWPPGRALGYHAITWGWLAGEVLRRVDGRSAGVFLREEIATPLGLDLHLGAPAEIDARTSRIAAGSAGIGLPTLLYWLRTPHRMPMRLRVFTNPAQREAKLDTRAWRAAEIPATNGISNARALAALYGVLACGGESGGSFLLRPAALARATRTQSEGRDIVFGFRSRFGLGFMLDSKHLGIAAGARSFGHTGAGGAFAFADPERRLAFAYTPNRPHPQPRLLVAPARDLVRAIYASL